MKKTSLKFQIKNSFPVLLLIAALILSNSVLYAQKASKKIDSLMEVAASSNDSIKLRIYNKVSFYYIFNDPKKAKNLLHDGINISQKENVPFSEAELTNTYGIYKDVSGEADSAKFYFEKALKLSKSKDYKTITVMIINNLGMFHWNKGHYKEALGYFFDALKMNRTNTTDIGDGAYLNNIGLIYQEMNQPQKALEYHKKALEIRKKHNDFAGIAASLNNIGISNVLLKNYSAAEKAFLEGRNVAKNENENGVYYNILNGLGDLYILQDFPKKAIPVLEESIKGRNKLNVDRRANLSGIANLIMAYNSTNNMPKAKQYINDGIAFLTEFPDLKNAAVDFYSAATQTYFKSGQTKMGNEFLEKTLMAKDSIFSSENAEKIADLETKFNISEKERDLAETRADLAEKHLEVRQKNTIIYGSLGLAFLLGLLGYLFYNQQKLKNRQLKKEGELKTALAKIETQNRLQEQRLRISRDLHDNIGAQLTFIISSIDNLKFGLKNAAQNTKDKLTNISSFTSQTIYELRDTIWAMNKESITFEDLQARITNFINQASAASKGIDFTFQVSETVSTEHTFTSVAGMNIYRIIQEAVNNALKYADAKNISVTISEEQNKFFISILDDGKGFNVTEIQQGNGLNNMKKRAQDLEGNIAFQSNVNEGTNVELTVPKYSSVKK